MPRFVKVCLCGIEQVKLAVTGQGFSSQRALAEDVGFALATVSNFLTGKPFDYITFEVLCDQLALTWRAFANNDVDLPSLSVDDPPSLTVDQKPQIRTSSKRLDLGQAIDVTNFYGRKKKLATLKQWIINHHCRLITLKFCAPA